MDDTEPPTLLRHVDDLVDETWDDPARGGARWRTLFSQDLTGTSALSTGVCTLGPGAALRPHRHETVETYFVLAGTGLLSLGTRELEVGAGTSVLIPSSTRHGILNTGAADLRFFYAFATDAFGDVDYVFDAPPAP